MAIGPFGVRPRVDHISIRCTPETAERMRLTAWRNNMTMGATLDALLDLWYAWERMTTTDHPFGRIAPLPPPVVDPVPYDEPIYTKPYKRYTPRKSRRVSDDDDGLVEGEDYFIGRGYYERAQEPPPPPKDDLERLARTLHGLPGGHIDKRTGVHRALSRSPVTQEA